MSFSCTGKNCPMQFGFEVKRCTAKDCRYRTEPKTNADRIRAMTDEELAVFLDDISNGCDNCPKRRYCLFDTEEDNCRDAFLKWLKEEVEHDT